MRVRSVALTPSHPHAPSPAPTLNFSSFFFIPLYFQQSGCLLEFISNRILILPGQNWNSNSARKKIWSKLEFQFYPVKIGILILPGKNLDKPGIPVLPGQNQNSNSAQKKSGLNQNSNSARSKLEFQFCPEKTWSKLEFQFCPVKIGIPILHGQIRNLPRFQF